ncbi:MAG: hypothetical protein AMK75_05075 [Planctomycetes bacterium SM23_65]|nr:MAG: hypothetical protein AMK75_05075 [Planctomycetes bacterium SM23_65]
MSRKHLLNVCRILVSVGLIVFVCYKIRLNDTLVKKDGTELAGRLLEKGPERFVVETVGGETATLNRSELLHDAEGRLIGVHRGVVTVLRDLHLAWFIPTFLFVGLIPVLGALRFHMLLGVQDVKVKLRDALGLTFLGNFFNNFMLGLTGGDVVKAYYVARQTEKRTEAVVTVFLDRMVGLIAMAVLAAAMVTVNLGDPKFRRAAMYVWVFLLMACFMGLMLYSRRLRRKVEYTMLVVLGAGGTLILASRVWTRGWEAVWREVLLFVVVVGLLALFTLTSSLRRLVRLDELRRALARSKLVREMDETFHVFSQSPGKTIIAFVISLVCHSVAATATYGFARALGIHTPYRYFLVFVPVILMIAAIPVSVAGWGVQEAVFQMFFGTVGVAATEAITLSFVFRLCSVVLWSLPGGVVFMLKKERPSVRQAARAVSEEEVAP